MRRRTIGDYYIHGVCRGHLQLSANYNGELVASAIMVAAPLNALLVSAAGQADDFELDRRIRLCNEN